MLGAVLPRMGHGVIALVLAGALGVMAGCQSPTQGQAPVQARRPAVGIGSPCTDNTQCDGFDNDTRLVICNVPTGMSSGVCYDCTTGGPRPVGCFCAADTDCASPEVCAEGRTCQTLRQRGEFCIEDSDCVPSDAMGPLHCLPTKQYCGPGPNGFFCDFGTDCLSGRCNAAGVCSAGNAGDLCGQDADCTAPLVCSTISGICISPQADGGECTRNQECVNQCNSFSGHCMQGVEGVACTTTGNPAGPNGDCVSGLLCTNCNSGFTCRPSGSNCP